METQNPKRSEILEFISPSENPGYTAALTYAEWGWPVIALHTPIGAGCSCRRPDCGSVGKHPHYHPEHLSHGLKDATTDAALIKTWWEVWPEANVGIVTGAASGLVVLDVDPPKGGDESLEHLEKEYGPLPETVEALTGGGGRHLLFQHPGGTLPNKVNLYPGLDIRADGGYIVAPPSVHASGRTYEWEVMHNPQEMAIAPIPAWLLHLIQAGGPHQPARTTLTVEGDKIPAGQRNSTFTSLAGSMRQKGMSPKAIEAALLEENLQRCEPPLTEAEVQKIAHSVGRYAPGPAKVQSSHPLRTIPLTDLDNAELMAAQHGQDLRYCPTLKKWLVFTGVRWEEDHLGGVYQKAKATIRGLYRQAIPMEDKGEKKKLLSHALNSESDAKINAMIRLASKEKGIPVMAKHLDRDPMLLNVLNGTLDLSTGTLLPHDRKHLITKLAPVTYDPEVSCPLWMNFLSRIMGGNRHMVEFLQRVVGYTLIGDNRERVFFILYGKGDNGKTTFLETIRALLGDYAQVAEFSTFLVKRSPQVRNDLAKLQGARFVSASEGDEGARLNAALLKSLTGGDKITTRRLYEEFFEYLPACKIFLATNHKPAVQDTSHGLWRRLCLISFTVTIPLAEQDKTLTAKLTHELQGILSWAVGGCLAWQEQGLDIPEPVRTATQKYQSESDKIGLFLQDCCAIETDARVSIQDLNQAFQTWAEEHGEDPRLIQNLRTKLQDMELIKKRSGKAGNVVWHGIRLKK
ncbi:MAG: DNA primase [Deltaproteobacteria bacterium]|nr:DNA primase [Deltaproteobacteria bacterium]